jgi:hypothetical protein
MMMLIRTTVMDRQDSHPTLGFIKRRNFFKSRAPWNKAEADLTGAYEALWKVKL